MPQINLNDVIIEEKREQHSSLEKTSKDSSEVVKDAIKNDQLTNAEVGLKSQKLGEFSGKESSLNDEWRTKDFFNEMVIEERPEVVKSITYKLKSHFVNHSIYITLGYIEMPGGRKRPLEIFINSKDLTKTAEFALLGRLLSAIFRRTPNPVFILEELNSLFDPNGGYLSNGRFYASIYAEIADVIERFFRDIHLLSSDSSMVGTTRIHSLEKNGKSLQVTVSDDDSVKAVVLEKSSSTTSNAVAATHQFSESGDKKMMFEKNAKEKASPTTTIPTAMTPDSLETSSTSFYRICPACDYKTLKFDNGCYICLTCGYSKCE